MTSKHTPGPWAMQESATHVRIVGADGENIWHEDKRCPRVMDDARLIAAAPELLEALVAVEALFGHLAADSTQKDWLDRARAAVAKATGASSEPRLAEREEYPPCPGCLDTECNGECMENL